MPNATMKPSDSQEGVDAHRQPPVRRPAERPISDRLATDSALWPSPRVSRRNKQDRQEEDDEGVGPSRPGRQRQGQR